MTILLMILSPIRIPSLIPRFCASEINSVDAAGRSAGRLNCAVLNALYKVTPSGANALPPTFCRVLKAPFMENGAFAMFSCAMTASVAVSYIVNPAMNLEPSGAIDSTVDCPATVRLRRITPDATSYTNIYVDWPGLVRPTINCPSGVRISLLKKAVSGRTSVVDGTPVIVEGGGDTCTGNRACED